MKKLLFIVLLVSFFLVGANMVLAQKSEIDKPCTGNLCLSNPLGDVNSPQALIGKVINSVLGVVGSIALLMFVYGGLIWMTSAGSPEKIKNGQDILVWSAIGLVVIFSAYGLTRFVLITIAQ
jgi:hypothetical protein